MTEDRVNVPDQPTAESYQPPAESYQPPATSPQPPATPKFSIIVPIYNIAYYNGENLFAKCMQSILSQTYPNFEVILVDDGSKDDAPQQCDAHAQADPRVVVIHKENGGPGAARNVGIQRCSGDYIFFVDADDEIDNKSCEMFTQFIDNHSDLDIITCDAKVIQKNKIEYWKFIPMHEGLPVSGGQFLIKQINNKALYPATWRQVIKKDFLLENNLFFREDLSGSEDAEWSVRLFLPARNILVSDIIHYIYNFNLTDASLSSPKDNSRLSKDIMSYCLDLNERFATIEDSVLRSCMKTWLIEQWLVAFGKGKFFGKKYRYMIRKDFLKDNTCSRKLRLRVSLFLFSPFLYYHIYDCYIAIMNCFKKGA